MKPCPDGSLPMYSVYNKSLGKTHRGGKKEVIFTARESPSSDEAKPIAACVTLRACVKALSSVVHDAPGALHVCRCREKFSQNVAAIELSPLVLDPNGAERDTFTTFVICDRVVFLL